MIIFSPQSNASSSDALDYLAQLSNRSPDTDLYTRAELLLTMRSGPALAVLPAASMT